MECVLSVIVFYFLFIKIKFYCEVTFFGNIKKRMIIGLLYIKIYIFFFNIFLTFFIGIYNFALKHLIKFFL
jgi:hypothetical protein